MQRKPTNPFFTQPQRTRPDDDAIELSVMIDTETASSESDNEPDEDSAIFETSYAIEYASIPIEAAVKSFKESWDEAASIPGDDFDTRMNKGCDKANNCLAAPFLFIPAGVISIFAFFGGAVRDAYEAAKRSARPAHHDTDIEDNNDFNP